MYAEEENSAMNTEMMSVITDCSVEPMIVSIMLRAWSAKFAGMFSEMN